MGCPVCMLIAILWGIVIAVGGFLATLIGYRFRRQFAKVTRWMNRRFHNGNR